jgi:aspartyl protease family protein
MKIINILIIAIIGGIAFLAYKYSYLIQTSDQAANVIYFLILLSVLILGIFNGRINLKFIAKNFIVWLGVFLLLIIGYSYKDFFYENYQRILSTISPSSAIVREDGSLIINRSIDGHYSVIGSVNGENVKFLVDTGASFVTLTYRDAKRAGIDVTNLKYDVNISTANGVSQVAAIIVDKIQIGNISFSNIKTFVARSGLNTSLLGMSFLDELKSVEFSNNKLILKN